MFLVLENILVFFTSPFNLKNVRLFRDYRFHHGGTSISMACSHCQCWLCEMYRKALWLHTNEIFISGICIYNERDLRYFFKFHVHVEYVVNASSNNLRNYWFAFGMWMA